MWRYGPAARFWPRILCYVAPQPSQVAFPEAVAPGHPCGGATLAQAETLVQTALHLAAGGPGGAAAAHWGRRKRRAWRGRRRGRVVAPKGRLIII